MPLEKWDEEQYITEPVKSSARQVMALNGFMVQPCLWAIGYSELPNQQMRWKERWFSVPQGNSIWLYWSLKISVFQRSAGTIACYIGRTPLASILCTTELMSQVPLGIRNPPRVDDETPNYLDTNFIHELTLAGEALGRSYCVNHDKEQCPLLVRK